MSIFQKIKALFLSFDIKSEFRRLSMCDGKPGLSMEDFNIFVATVASVHKDFSAHSGAAKSQKVVEMVSALFRGKVSDSFIQILVWLAYKYASKSGIINS